MLILFVSLRIFRRSLWWFFAGLIFGLIGVAGRLRTLPAIDCLEDFLLGPDLPVPPYIALVFAFLFFFFGIFWNTRKYLFLLSQATFDSRVQKTPHWQNHLMPKIQKEIEAGELVFPSFAESRSMTPQEYMTRMFVAKTHWNDPELRKHQPKLRDSIFKI